MEKNKTQEIKNFIGIYDNYITEEECDKAINLFKEQNKFNNTLNRLQFEGSNFLEKKDEQFFARRNNIDTWWNNLKTLIINYFVALIMIWLLNITLQIQEQKLPIITQSFTTLP